MSCDHEVAEDSERRLTDDGYLVSECRLCGREIWADRIDQEYFEDTAEIVVLNWEVL